MKPAALFTLAMHCITNPAIAAGYRIALIETGKRDDYYAITVQIRNQSNEPPADLNGHFVSLVRAEGIGRNKGASFLNVGPSTTALTDFEPPNAPCREATGYRFLVCACRIGLPFMDQDDCGNRIQPETPIMETLA